MSVDTGDGTTITFATTGFTANLIDLSGPSPSRGDVDQSHLGSSDYMTFVPTGLIDGGSFTMTIQYDPTVTIPLKEPPETVTIDPAGSGNVITFPGYLNSIDHSFAIGELMQATVSGKVAGTITGL